QGQGSSSSSGQTTGSGDSASQGQGSSSSSGQSTGSSDSATDTASSGSGVGESTATNGAAAPIKTPTPRARAGIPASRLASGASPRPGELAVAVTVAITSVRVHSGGFSEGNHVGRPLPETDVPSAATDQPQPSTAAPPLMCAKASFAPCVTLA